MFPYLQMRELTHKKMTEDLYNHVRGKIIDMEREELSPEVLAKILAEREKLIIDAMKKKRAIEKGFR